MTLERRIVSIGGPLVLLSGVVCAALPGVLGQLAGISANASGLTDLRAIYGGMQIGLGVFLLWCRSDPERTQAGLVALGSALASIALLRIIGMLVDQAPTAFHAANLSLEVGASALVLYALSRSRSVAAVV